MPPGAHDRIRKPTPRNKEHGARMRLLRVKLGYMSAKAFAVHVLDTRPSRWNNAEQGYGVSQSLAHLLREKLNNRITYEWIFDGELEGLHPRLRELLMHRGTVLMSNLPISPALAYVRGDIDGGWMG